jgi:hypothetical protein
MKTFKKLFFLWALFFSLSVYIKADTITLTASNLLSASYNVPSNVVAQIVHSSVSPVACASYKINVTVNSQTITYTENSVSAPYQILNLPIVAGPATITLVNNYASGNCSPNLPAVAICTIETSVLTSSFTGSVPSTAVVIPNDNGGPVTIVLESSTDLINWTSALPGTYGTTSTNRFFRVRATR